MGNRLHAGAGGDRGGHSGAHGYQEHDGRHFAFNGLRVRMSIDCGFVHRTVHRVTHQ